MADLLLLSAKTKGAEKTSWDEAASDSLHVLFSMVGSQTWIIWPIKALP